MSSVITLVDDDQNILASVRMALESEGFIVRSYNDGASALEGINKDPCLLYTSPSPRD